jgi:cytochrome P450
MTVSYWAGEGVAIGGVAIDPGTLCTVVLGAANHDHRVFEDPSTFDITRPRASAPLSFGFGAHYCLGAALAKMEADVVLGEMVRRFPRMELASEPRRVPLFRARTFEDLWVRLDPPRR